MGRKPCCDKIGLRRGPWSIEEDHRLMNFILHNGIHCWRIVPKLAGLLRCGKSCRLRWINYLRPDLKRGGFTDAEEDRIMELHSQLGNRWSKIASHFSGRTDNEIKNHWNTKIKKKMKHLGLNPATHEPMNNITNQPQSMQITKPNMCSTIKEREETKGQPKDEFIIETKKTSIISNNDELLLAKNCKTLYAEEVDIRPLFKMQGNETSVSSLPSLYSNISRSEYSSYLAEDSISLEQWGLTDMTDPLVPWDLLTNLDDTPFLL
ncbi:transcription factor MYB20-like [Brassica napus]|uniref:(rape) hypothetical protein n=1 Tax=Brassica napus TaxID=3708 RepID=A0A816JG54_BRANA|nr:transcription factor MYB20-like [Brassica napus]CAF1844231.1 unnamed protein product [Brassica napus]